MINTNFKGIEEPVIPLEKREEILMNQDKYYKMEHCKITRLKITLYQSLW